MARALAQKLLTFARARSLFCPGDRVLLAVSGGADSTALILLAQEALARPFRLNLGVAHFNHGFRGVASDRDEAFVRALAFRLGLPFFPGRGKNILQAGASPEARAREARYRFLRTTAKREGYDCVATAHHMDDQAETVLMRVLKGCPLSGLQAIRPKNGIIVRPLLCLRRSEITDYLKSRRQPFRTDASNRDLKFLRNRIRRRVIPFLEKEMNPSLIPTLSQLAERVSSFLHPTYALKGNPTHALKSHPTQALKGYPTHALKGYPTQALTGNPTHARKGPAPEFEFPLKPGTYQGPESITLKISFASPSKAGPFPAAGAPTAFLDADKLASKLSLASRKPGDRFFPLGAPGPAKLKAFMINRKIPEKARGRVPLLRSGGEIAWVVGHRIGEPFKVGPATRKIAIVKAVI